MADKTRFAERVPSAVDPHAPGKCQECQFYSPAQAQCRNKPPVGVVMGVDASGIRAVSVWPVVQPDWWCGEFAAINWRPRGEPGSITPVS